MYIYSIFFFSPEMATTENLASKKEVSWHVVSQHCDVLFRLAGSGEKKKNVAPFTVVSQQKRQ